MTNTGDIRNYVINHLEEAIEREDIKICYQPIIRSLTGDICGQEALARWDSPEYGLMLPEKFIPILEEMKLIHKLDAFMIGRVCRHYNNCLSRHDPLVPISLNLSWLDFELCDIIKILNDEIEKNRVPREMIRIEINESLISHDRELIKNKLKALSEEGYVIIMDDFGSGHSSINILKDYVFNELKIDMRLLWDSGDRAKTIISSLCSLAKSFGITTVAEGVEDREQVRFLKKAGCEKLQGYYFAKPMFYWDLLSYAKEQGLSYEPLSLRDYYDTLGHTDITKKAERSYGIAELSNDGIHFLYANEIFMKNLQSLEVESFEELEMIVNDPSRTPKTKFSQMVKRAVERKKPQVIDFVWKGNYCIGKVELLTGGTKKNAVEVELNNLSMDKKVTHLERINDALDSVYSLFNRVVEFDLDKDRLRVLYKETAFTEKYEGDSYSANKEKYINSEIYPEDRERYRQFADFKNAEQRIVNSGKNYISGCFRFRTQNGNYVWREQHIILSRGKGEGHLFLLCTREVDEKQLALLMQLSSFITSGEGGSGGFDGKAISDSTLWKALVDTCPVGLFWKDINRRFLGVNQAFLDYYGFESESTVLGKTDEEMNWHIDPLPFKRDEESIINSGTVIREASGKCLARGENRDIVVNKAPIYRDGKIVGIIGFFRDITERLERYDILKTESLSDPVTGVLNIRGLMESVSKYIGAYENNKADFAMIAINISHYDETLEEYGSELADSLMLTVAERLKKSLGNTSVIARTANDTFLVIRQVERQEEGSSLLQNISNEIRYIKDVNGTPFTIYTSAGYAAYSECGSPEALYSLTVRRMNDQMERIRRFTGGY